MSARYFDPALVEQLARVLAAAALEDLLREAEEEQDLAIAPAAAEPEIARS